MSGNSPDSQATTNADPSVTSTRLGESGPLRSVPPNGRHRGSLESPGAKTPEPTEYPQLRRLISDILVKLYRFKRLKPVVVKIARRMEGGEFYSQTLRRIFAQYWGVEIGMYSHGDCFVPWAFDPNTKVGRYCSIAKGVRVVNGNHPIHLKSTSALFHNPALGYCEDWIGPPLKTIEIGNDVWIGANAVVLPEVNRIGDGAVIGAGAVVSKDVPPYGVVLGNPARLVKYRFSEETIASLLEEKWWESDIEELRNRLDEFQEFHLK